MLKLDIAVLGNLRYNAPHQLGEPADIWGELDSESTLTTIVEALEDVGHSAYFVEGDLRLPAKLAQQPPDICFNLCKGYGGDGREAQVPALLEMMGIPYTGSHILTQALCRDKAMTKSVLAAQGLPTPPFQLFHTAQDGLDPALRFPLFVKPNQGGSGMGVTPQSIVHDEGELRSQVAYIIRAYEQDALVEEYIEGCELTCGLVGNEEPHLFPILEIDLSTSPADQHQLYTGLIKDEFPEAPTYRCPAPIDETLAASIREMTIRAATAVRALDMARVDFRVDARNGNLYLLEIDPLPRLVPDRSDLVIMAAAERIDHAQLVNRILDTAVERLHLRDRQGKLNEYRVKRLNRVSVYLT